MHLPLPLQTHLRHLWIPLRSPSCQTPDPRPLRRQESTKPLLLTLRDEPLLALPGAFEGHREGDVPKQGKHLPNPFLETARAQPWEGRLPGCPGQLRAQAQGGPLSPRRAPLPQPPNFPAEVCARPGPGRRSARPPDEGRERRRRKTERPGDGAREPAREGAREPASKRTQGPRQGLTMARGEARTRKGEATLRPRNPRAAGESPYPVQVPKARHPGVSYLGDGGGPAPGCGLQRSGRLGESGGGAGAQGSRGAGSPGTAARRPAAPPHLQLGQGRWPRGPGREGDVLEGGRRREAAGGGTGGRGGGRGGGARGAASLPHSLPRALARSHPPSLQTPCAAAAPGRGRQLPGGVCAPGGGGGRLAREGRERRKGGWPRDRAPGGRAGEGAQPGRAPPPRPPHGSAPGPRAALGHGREVAGGGGAERSPRYPALGVAREGAGARAQRRSPADREDGGGRRGREGGDPLLLLQGHLGQTPRGPGQWGRRPECFSAGPDFPAQPSSRNVWGEASRFRPCNLGSRSSSALRASATPGWSLPCPWPQFPLKWNKRETWLGAIRASTVLVSAAGTTSPRPQG